MGKITPPLGWLWFEYKPEWTASWLATCQAEANRPLFADRLPLTVPGYRTPLVWNQVISFPAGIELKTVVSLEELEASRSQPNLTLAIVQVLGRAEVLDDGSILAYRIYKHSIPAWEFDTKDSYKAGILVRFNKITFDDLGYHSPWQLYRALMDVYRLPIVEALIRIQAHNLIHGIEIVYPDMYLSEAEKIVTGPNKWLAEEYSEAFK